MPVSVHLPDETAKALEELARTTERSKTSLILKALVSEGQKGEPLAGEFAGRIVSSVQENGAGAHTGRPAANAGDLSQRTPTEPPRPHSYAQSSRNRVIRNPKFAIRNPKFAIRNHRP